MAKPIYLGVNVDHVATLRQARGTDYPDPVAMALQAEKAGADGITMHLREDRRHIQEGDVERFLERGKGKLNLEIAATEEMRDFALRVRPADVCVVPERREELTTEGGLDVAHAGRKGRLVELVAALSGAGIRVSMFIDAVERQIEACREIGAPMVELHTGQYANAPAGGEEEVGELRAIAEAARVAHGLGLVVNAGHGLHYRNTRAVAALPQVNELNIGHAVVARAVEVGFAEAVGEMKRVMREARGE